MTRTRSRIVAQCLEEGRAYLLARGVDEVDANAEFLMAEVLGCGRSKVKASGERRLTEKQDSHFRELIRSRGRRIPLAYVLGFQPFMGLDIKVAPSVLIPRPETEQLVECVVQRAEAEGVGHIVEIGTGSGCVAVALAHFLPQATIYATEISASAMTIAVENARANNVERRIRFLREDLFKPAKTSSPWADLIVTNPPYIPTSELAGLSREVHREPILALDGGKDGMDAVRAITADAPRMLKPGGWFFMEIALGKAASVQRVLEQGGFVSVEVHRDLAGMERILGARRPGESGK